MTATELKPLTTQQHKVLQAIITHFKDEGVPPTVRDLMGPMGFSSPNGVVCHLKALETKGLITRNTKGSEKQQARGIRIRAIDDAVKSMAKVLLETIKHNG